MHKKDRQTHRAGFWENRSGRSIPNRPCCLVTRSLCARCLTSRACAGSAMADLRATRRPGVGGSARARRTRRSCPGRLAPAPVQNRSVRRSHPASAALWVLPLRAAAPAVMARLMALPPPPLAGDSSRQAAPRRAATPPRSAATPAARPTWPCPPCARQRAATAALAPAPRTLWLHCSSRPARAAAKARRTRGNKKSASLEPN